MSVGDWFSDPQNYIFLAIALPMLFAGFRVVTSSNVVHAVLFLVAALAGSAAMFLMLGAEFVAWTVVLVYIGAVVVLFLFGIMITRAPLGTDTQLNHERRWPAALVALSVFAVMAYAITEAFEDAEITDNLARTDEIGTVLFDRFVLPFEVVSVLLLAALIGGIVLARAGPRDRGGADMTITQFALLASALFSLGVYGVLVRRNAVMVLLSVELMLAAVTLNFVAFGSFLNDEIFAGQIFALFIITVAAAEVGIGLAIVLLIFRNRRSANVDELDLMRW